MTRIIGLIAIIAASAFTMAVTYLNDEPPATSEGPGPMAVSVAVIAPQPAVDLIAAYGRVRPRWRTALAAEAAGRVTSVSPAFLSGATFAKGDVLATIDPAAHKAALAAAQSTLATAVRELAEEKQRARIAKKNWRTSGFKGAPSSLALRRPQLREAEAAIQSARAEIAIAKRNLAETQIRAPYDAVVVERTINPGDYVMTGAPVGTIYDARVLEVVAPLRLDQVDRLPTRLASTPILLRDQRDGRTWRGGAARLEPGIDLRNRQRNLVIEVTEGAGLVPGQFLAVEVPGAAKGELLAVPEHFSGVDGAVWFVDHENRLRAFTPDVLFRRDGALYIRPGPEAPAPWRLTRPRPNFLAGLQIKPVPATAEAPVGLSLAEAGR